MTTIYTRRLVGRQMTGPGPTVIATCPANETWVLRDLVVLQNGPAAELVNLYVNTGSSFFHILREVIEPLVTVRHELRQAMGPGEYVTATVAGAGNTLSIALTAYVFQLDA